MIDPEDVNINEAKMNKYTLTMNKFVNFFFIQIFLIKLKKKKKKAFRKFVLKN